MTATAQVVELQNTVERYVESGYLPSFDGQLFDLDDFQKEAAKRNYVDFAPAGYPERFKDFAAWADIKLSSAAPANYPEFSGCGFIFHAEDNGDSYSALVTKDSIVVGYCLASGRNGCGRVGKTRGTGTLQLSNPLDVHFEFIVHGMHAYALVDRAFVAEYTLFADQIADPGHFGYGMISGTNRGYGTRCEISNAKLWVATQ
jgi:hypothetical protein